MRVFIAGPYGDSNPKSVIAKNVKIVGKVAKDFMAAGHQVYCPHTMSWGWEDDPRMTRKQYLDLDQSFLYHWAEAIYRIPGYSQGADGEMATAEALGLVLFDHVPGPVPSV